MTQYRLSRSIARAHRLQIEARNCLAIAVSKPDGFTADLIDEAVRLNARARELARYDTHHTARVPADASL